MTTEEKARKYDEAVNRARKLKESPDEVSCKFNLKDKDVVCDYIFPELSSEEPENDEKVLDGLISFFREECPYEIVGTGDAEIKVTDIISFLDSLKQKQNIWFRNTKDNKPAISHSVIMMTAHGISEGEWTGDMWLQYWWSSKLKDEEVLLWTECSYLQKTIPDNVRVRNSEDFNEGEWITDGSENLYVSGKSGKSYSVLTADGTRRSIGFDSAWKYHKWTVKDARRGDILVDNADNLPFILGTPAKNGAMLPLCGIVNEFGDFRFLDDWTVEDCIGLFVDVSPAGKEQRKQILDALGNAGYIYDYPNKVIRKAE